MEWNEFIKCFVTILGSIITIILAVSTPFFIINVIFPFLVSFSAEKRFEKFIDTECLKGNQIAITIRRGRFGYISERDRILIYEAIKGNEYAIKALRIGEKQQFPLSCKDLIAKLLQKELSQIQPLIHLENCI